MYLLTMGGHLDSPDEELMFQVTRSLAERGSMEISASVLPLGLTLGGVDGRSYVPYGPVSSVLSVPFFELGVALAAPLPRRFAEVVARFAVGLRDPLFSAGASVLFYAVAIELGYRRTVALALTLSFGVATFAWPFSKYAFSEPVTGFWLLLAVFAAIRAVHADRPVWSALSGVALGLAIGSKVTTAVAVPALVVYLVAAGSGSLVHRARRLLPFALVFLLPAGGLGLMNFARFGNPLETGYHLDGLIDLSNPIGIAGLLVSPDKSLFLYAPVALLGLAGLACLARRLSWETALFVWLVASHVLVYGVLLIWHGDGGWGPRYLVPVLPFIVLPAGAMLAWTRGAARRLSWASFGVLFGLGAVVNVGGVLVDQRVSFDVIFEAAGGNIADNSPRWNPALSPVLIHWNEIAKRTSMFVQWWSQPVSLVSGTYGKEADLHKVTVEPDLFPRWTSGSAVFDLKNRGQPAEFTLQYFDNRPSEIGPAVVQVVVNGSALRDVDVTRRLSDVPAAGNLYPLIIEEKLDDAVVGHASSTVEIRSQTWRAPPDVRDLGIEIWDLRFRSNGQDFALGEAVFSPMPVSDERPWSYELMTWFYTPPWHLADVWLWYLYLSDLPHWLMLIALVPAATLLWSGSLLWRLLVSPATNDAAQV
jgi:hypothetical protein